MKFFIDRSIKNYHIKMNISMKQRFEIAVKGSLGVLMRWAGAIGRGSHGGNLGPEGF